MSKKRKTIEVSKVLELANVILGIVETPDNKKYFNDDVKAGVCQLLEQVLHETGNYSGFNYNEWINRGGYKRWREDSKGDPTFSTAPYLGQEHDRFYYSK